MVEIKASLFSEPKEGLNYIITEAKQEIIKSGNKEYDGIVVTMKSTDTLDDNIYTVTLWLSDMASSTSKLGSFLCVLGNDTDKWIDKTIKIRQWRNKLREIEVIS